MRRPSTKENESHSSPLTVSHPMPTCLSTKTCSKILLEGGDDVVGLALPDLISFFWIQILPFCSSLVTLFSSPTNVHMISVMTSSLLQGRSGPSYPCQPGSNGWVAGCAGGAGVFGLLQDVNYTNSYQNNWKSLLVAGFPPDPSCGVRRRVNVELLLIRS